MSYVLCETNHLSKDELTRARRDPLFWSKELEKRLRFAKRAILRETKPGELILLEGGLARVAINQIPNARLLEESEAWKKLFMRQVNIYSELAEYTIAHGRKAASIDSGIFSRRPGRVEFLLWKKDAPIEETSLVAAYQRNRLMEARIKKQKPKLVLIARDHVVWLESNLPPKKTVWFTRGMTHKRKLRILYRQVHGLSRIRELRTARRAKINALLRKAAKRKNSPVRRAAKR